MQRFLVQTLHFEKAMPNIITAYYVRRLHLVIVVALLFEVGWGQFHTDEVGSCRHRHALRPRWSALPDFCFMVTYGADVEQVCFRSNGAASLKRVINDNNNKDVVMDSLKISHVWSRLKTVTSRCQPPFLSSIQSIRLSILTKIGLRLYTLNTVSVVLVIFEYWALALRYLERACLLGSDSCCQAAQALQTLSHALKERAVLCRLPLIHYSPRLSQSWML